MPASFLPLALVAVLAVAGFAASPVLAAPPIRSLAADVH